MAKDITKEMNAQTVSWSPEMEKWLAEMAAEFKVSAGPPADLPEYPGDDATIVQFYHRRPPVRGRKPKQQRGAKK